MDAKLSCVTPDEYGTFHAMDRKLYSVLAVELWRDPYESVQVLALWLWMERLGFKNFVLTILSMPLMLIKEYADEALACVKCMNDPQFLFSAGVGGMPLTSNLIKKKLSLLYFYENRATLVIELQKVVTEICAMVLQDLLEDAIRRHAAYDSLIHSFANSSFVGETSMRSSHVPPEEERTAFVTFSKGYPITELEIRAFFTNFFGNCIEAFHMQQVRPNEQPLYARIVFSTPSVIDLVLNGVTKAKFAVNGKHLWVRKFVPNGRSSSPMLPLP